MNILLWVLQILLAFWNLTGGIFTFSHYEELRSPMASDFPKAFWVVLCTLQVLFSVGILIPKLTPIAAGYLAVNALFGCLWAAKYAGFPGMLWGVIPAVLCAFVVYGRISQ